MSIEALLTGMRWVEGHIMIFLVPLRGTCHLHMYAVAVVVNFPVILLQGLGISLLFTFVNEVK